MPRLVKTSSMTCGGVGVLAGQHPVAGGDEHDLGPQPEVGLGELGTGDAGADDDQPLGQGVEVVDLLPGEDALAVGAGGVHDARAGAGGDQHDVGLELEHPVGRLGATPVVAEVSTARPASTRTPTSASRVAMSSLCAAARSSTLVLTSRRSATASATSSPSASSRCTPSSWAVSKSLM